MREDLSAKLVEHFSYLVDLLGRRHLGEAALEIFG